MFRLIQAYSALFVTLTYSQPCHIVSPGIFRKGGLFKTLSNIYQTYSEPCHGHYSAIFRHIQNLMQCLHMQKPGILRILEYSELLHNCVATRIRTLSYLRKFFNSQNSNIKTQHIFRTLSKI